MKVRPATAADLEAYVRLRAELWPDDADADHRCDAQALLARAPSLASAFLAWRSVAEPAGFAEASVRADYVNGCDGSPVAFLEGVYVRPAYRRGGAATRLIAAVEDWARAAGCRELASDAEVGNLRSHHLLRASGFAETERVVFFRKALFRTEPGFNGVRGRPVS